MRILIVHQYYLLKGRPGGSRFNELARMWSDAGHDVTVIAGTMDYQTGTTPAEYRGRWVTEEQDGPVRVLRCYVPQTYSKSAIGRAWAFFGFTLSSLSAVFRVLRPDVVIATSPPLVAVFPGVLASRLAGSPFVFEIRDLWPESAVTMGILAEGSILTRVLYAVERWACHAATKINVLTPAFRENLLARRLAEASKIAFIPNGADVDLFRPASRDNRVRFELGWGDRFVVLYAGAHGRANAVGQLLDAAKKVQHARPDILFATVGDGPERATLEARIRDEGLTNVMICGPQPKERMADFVNACDLGAAVLQDNPTFRTVYPNKVFDYMACARPVLLAIDGVARRLVCDDAQAGVFVRPEDPEALASAVVTLADSPAERAQLGARGRAWVLANATRESLARRYLDLLEQIVPAMRSVSA